jgi:Short C-terminal domain
MLRRAAVLGATARVASNRGRARAEAARQQAAAAPPPAPVQDEAPAPAPPQDTYGDLMKLKELLDAGALTQEEFDTQNQKILGT